MMNLLWLLLILPAGLSRPGKGLGAVAGWAVASLFHRRMARETIGHVWHISGPQGVPLPDEDEPEPRTDGRCQMCLAREAGCVCQECGWDEDRGVFTGLADDIAWRPR